jgi:hypothetical protein
METIDRNSFEDNSRAFLNNDVPFLHCETVQQRNLVLGSLNAKVGAVEFKTESEDATILSRKTSREDIVTEDHIPKDKSMNTTFQIFRVGKDDN